VDGVKLLKNVSFIVGKDDKIAFVGENELAVTMLLQDISRRGGAGLRLGEVGRVHRVELLPLDNSAYFDGCD
jgi:ABC-type polysaccharide/polyol phosphate transport system ATPase subunit